MSRRIGRRPLEQQSPDERSEETFRPPDQRQKQVRLRSDQVDELVAAYLAGAPQHELAARFGIHDTAVRAHLRRRSVLKQRPYRKLRGDALERAVELYNSGMSLRAVASEVDLSREAVRTGLLAAGIRLRAAGFGTK